MEHSLLFSCSIIDNGIFLMEFVMRSKATYEMITIKDAQRLLHVNRKVLNDMIRSGQLKTEKTGNLVKINMKSLKACCSTNDYCSGIAENVSSSELEMIADWT